MKKQHLDILFRSCSRSEEEMRYIDAPKADITLACLRSLIRSIHSIQKISKNLTIKLHILDDHSDDDTIDAIKRMLKGSGLDTAVFATTSETGQGASMRFANEYAKENCHALIYFVEDDYLHTESAILEMVDAYTQFSSKLNRHVIISPCDHATEYVLPDLNLHGPARIVLGMSRHWRTTFGSTSTYLIDRWTLDTYWDTYQEHSKYTVDNHISENTTINSIYLKEHCFSPLPSLTAHLGDESLKPPFMDVEALWKRNRPRKGIFRFSANRSFL